MKLDYGVKIIPTCFYANFENEYIIGAEKCVYFNDKKVFYAFSGKIK